MTPERWRQINETFLVAVRQATSQRQTFLDEACAGDPSLRADVEKLLANDEATVERGFLEQAGVFPLGPQPHISIASYEIVGKLHREASAEAMTLSSGTLLGPYEILSPLGKGGMGEVYRARDTKLDRDVAIKVLPQTFGRDSERLARFQREAKLLASLNHPNVAAIHGFEESDGVCFLVLELVEGETLSARLKAGPLAVDEALSVAKQIAEALEAAHESGVIHRDVKPANVKVRPDGKVKVLDFGLAKALSAGNSPTDIGRSPTMMAQHTRQGVILGTAAYMSPEQARGQPLDKRTDIWSFGCVLYECLTGRGPFGGETTSDTIAKILEREPDWSAVPAKTPQMVQILLRRCLRKDRERRLHDVADARSELEDVLSGSSEAWSSAIQPIKARRKTLTWAVAGFAIVVALSFALAYLRPAGTHAAVIRSFIPAPDNTRFMFTSDLAGPVIISPDGRAVTFVAVDAEGKNLLWLRPLDDVSARVLPSTKGATFPFWSADSRSIGFFAKGRLKRIEASGGLPITVCDVRNGRGGTWSRQGVILFAPDYRTPIYQVAASGGTPIPVTKLDESKHTTHRWPYFLPDGKHFLYLAVNQARGRREHDAVYFASIDSAETNLVLRTNANAAFASGFLLFLRDTTLMADRFDARRGQLKGDPLPVAEGIRYDPATWQAVFTASQSGILAYHTGGVVGTKLVWFDRSGNELGSIGEKDIYSDLRLSPDGRRLAVGRGDPGDIFIYELARRGGTRLTFDPADDGSPIWSPDGTRIVFSTAHRTRGQHNIYQKLSSGTSSEEMFLESGIDVSTEDWSPDGRFILYSKGDIVGGSQGDIWILPLSGDREPFVFMQTPFAEYDAQFSPEGRWIAYTSNESDKEEVYVAPFPELSAENTKNREFGRGGKWQVSADGGALPRWRRDGKELFYLAPDKKLMAAEVNSEGSHFEVGAVHALFRVNPKPVGYAYDVSPDGQQFVINTAGEKDTSPITLVVNWTAELNK